MASVRVTLQGVNLASDAAAAARAGACGAGLVCLESIILERGVHPRKLLAELGPQGYADLLSEPLVAVCRAFPGYPVSVRTLDFSVTDLARLEGGLEMRESNPALGWRGIRRDLEWPEHHAAQWMAFHRVFEAGCDNLGVLLPMVHDVEQLHAAQWMRDGAGLGARCGLGILVETPAAALCIERFVDANVDFVAFGVGDLTQLTLGMDRTHPHLMKACDVAHPAVLRLIGGAAAVCEHAGIETSVCGLGTSDPAMAEQFLSLGIDAISCDLDALPAVQCALDRARLEAGGH